ncbi:AraC-like DNA-binding protein [Chryseobacterium ginsenosidimutans]|uniref:helix-turn-helix domain-containing protein n=1 Tax=Chryseobacterium ginsenosidimutans TaxID=687846 RepID=UPI002166F835|nr:AraC family transcriptional regulator [Chryseobacterium ginsenosidimutans]MCS3868620.1 AraC-like DNA-binding protein [Chryseobacterium ginsenosidimutans]
MSNLIYQSQKPDSSISDYVESFWMLDNPSENKEVILLPDGRIDLIFSQSAKEPFDVVLLGIGTHPEQIVIAEKTKIFSVSFNLLATEYILHQSVSELLNSAKVLPIDFWNFNVDDLNDFEKFCEKISLKIKKELTLKIDERKLKLFDLIYSAKGSLTVKELSEKVIWSERQINRYFNQQFGISLKSYCGILRFRASFQHIKEGKLFPEQNFTDQSHFIKEIKKLSGFLPKELNQNKNDRFIQFSVLPEK